MKALRPLRKSSLSAQAATARALRSASGVSFSSSEITILAARCVSGALPAIPSA